MYACISSLVASSHNSHVALFHNNSLHLATSDSLQRKVFIHWHQSFLSLSSTLASPLRPAKMMKCQVSVFCAEQPLEMFDYFFALLALFLLFTNFCCSLWNRGTFGRMPHHEPWPRPGSCWRSGRCATIDRIFVFWGFSSYFLMLD